MDDLISRMDAVQATRVSPSDEWSRATKDGYELAATDIMMNVLKIPAADASPLGAVAMRDACLDVYLKGNWDWFSDAHDAMEEIPLPTHAALLAAALNLPEVAAMRDAGKPLLDMTLWTESAADGEMVIMTVGTIRKLRHALAALEAKP